MKCCVTPVQQPDSTVKNSTDSGTTGDESGDKAPEKVPEKAPEKAPEEAPEKASDLPKPGKNLTDKTGTAAAGLGVTKEEVEKAIHNIKGKPEVKVDQKLSGGQKNPDVFIDKNNGDVFWNYQGRVGPKIGNIFSPPRGR